jgi:hypothetical protein
MGELMAGQSQKDRDNHEGQIEKIYFFQHGRILLERAEFFKPGLYKFSLHNHYPDPILGLRWASVA